MEIKVTDLAVMIKSAWEEGYEQRTREELANVYANQVAKVPEPPKRGRPRKVGVGKDAPVPWSGIEFQDSKGLEDIPGEVMKKS